MTTEAIAERVREAVKNRTPLRISGAGTWMNAGRPVAADETLSLAGDKGIVEYVPDDLTITVRAGTTLDEIAGVTRERGQWLPLDPLGGGAGTIGAAIATASSGPLSHSFGFARDLILGLEFVSGKGHVVKSGGRVVKNVAGFDMMRLTCGAWGTLGVITQATLRLYALPKVDRTFAIELPDSPSGIERSLEQIGRAPIAPLALELLSAPLAAKIGLSPRTTVLARIAGNESLVEAQIKTLSKIGELADAGASAWAALSSAHSSGHAYALRMSGLPAKFTHGWETAREIANGDGTAFFHGTFSRGITHVAGSSLERPALSAADTDLKVAYRVLPAAEWRALSPSVIGDALSRSVRNAFDPHSILNPGILG